MRAMVREFIRNFTAPDGEVIEAGTLVHELPLRPAGRPWLTAQWLDQAIREGIVHKRLHPPLGEDA